FIASAVLLITFIINESRSKHPLMPLSIFKIRNVSGANVIQLLNAASLFSVFFFSSLYLQDVLGYSPVRTGLSFLVVPIAIAIAATNAPRLIKRLGYKPLLVFAPLLTAIGLYMLSHISVSGGYLLHIMPGMIVMGFGLGFTFVSVLVAATSGVAAHLSGLASGLINTAQQIGGSLGLAILTGLVASSTVRYLQHVHSNSPAVVATATVHGFRVGFYIATGFAITASLLAMIIIKQKSPGAEHPPETTVL
ncbi:MAG TPA: MFS transporter, partial [Candidatus Saccharimonadales bacterium]|nr:MFS transporter [Candidatus Saccharimonadales bacterium]